jgi:EAL domain-containing protein (putative c-di-GMP-specific phosphodiesterase class I)
VNDEIDSAITTAIIAMAKSLRLRVLAEGVETNGQLEALLLRRCDEIKMFLIFHMVPANKSAKPNVERQELGPSGSLIRRSCCGA